MISQKILSQIKADTLTSFNIYDMIQQTGQQLDDKDYAILNNYLRTTKNLRELVLTNAWSTLDYLYEGLMENTSISRLNACSVISNSNVGLLEDLLKKHPTISYLDISANGIEGEHLTSLAAVIGARAELTHITAEGINYNRDLAEYDVSPLVAALSKSPNLLSFNPARGEGIEELQRMCAANRQAAEAFVDKYLNEETFIRTDIDILLKNAPAILSVAEEKLDDKSKVAQMLVDLEDAASAFDIGFVIPPFYEELAATIPRQFKPATGKLDFAKRPARKALTTSEIFTAAAAGQVSELLSFMHKQGDWVTSDDCLFKPADSKESVIEVIARQGALADFMAAANWAGDARGFKAAADAVPEREWKRQMGDATPGQMLSLVNAASFKKKSRQPQAKG